MGSIIIPMAVDDILLYFHDDTEICLAVHRNLLDNPQKPSTL